MAEPVRKRRNIGYVLGLVALIVLPTVVTLGFHQITQNPSFRPLAVTRQSLDAYERSRGARQGVEIVAQVEWVGPVAARMSQRQFEKAITQAFNAKGVEVYVFFTHGVEATRVTYVVGPSRIGPYPAKRAGDGVQAAVDAYRMFVPAM